MAEDQIHSKSFFLSKKALSSGERAPEHAAPGRLPGQAGDLPPGLLRPRLHLPRHHRHPTGIMLYLCHTSHTTIYNMLYWSTGYIFVIIDI